MSSKEAPLNPVHRLNAPIASPKKNSNHVHIYIDASKTNNLCTVAIYNANTEEKQTHELLVAEQTAILLALHRCFESPFPDL